jgi:hypothetical protein
LLLNGHYFGLLKYADKSLALSDASVLGPIWSVTMTVWKDDCDAIMEKDHDIQSSLCCPYALPLPAYWNSVRLRVAC